MGSVKPAAQQAVHQLIDRYGQSDFAVANHVVAIGGDGTALRALHASFSRVIKAVFAMRLPGSCGALGNPFYLEKLPKRLQASQGDIDSPTEGGSNPSEASPQTDESCIILST